MSLRSREDHLHRHEIGKVDVAVEVEVEALAFGEQERSFGTGVTLANRKIDMSASSSVARSAAGVAKGSHASRALRDLMEPSQVMRLSDFVSLKTLVSCRAVESCQSGVFEQEFGRMQKLSEYVQVAEAASILGVSQNTLRTWAEDSKIPMHRNPANGYRLFRRSALEGFLREVAQPARTANAEAAT